MQKYSVAAFAGVVALLLAGTADAQNHSCPYPMTLQNGAVANADHVMGNFGAMQNCLEWMGGNLTTAGTANAQTLAPTGFGGYIAGQRFLFKVGANLTNNGAVTLNIGGFGAKSILSRIGTALGGGELQAGQWTEVTYDGTNFVLLSPDRMSGYFTPTIILGGGSVTSYFGQYGAYRRIGDIVYFTLFVWVNTVSSPSGDLFVGGLPFQAPSSNPLAFAPVTVQFIHFDVPNGAPIAQVWPGTNTIQVRNYVNTDTSTIGWGTRIHSAIAISGFYFAAD